MPERSSSPRSGSQPTPTVADSTPSAADEDPRGPDAGTSRQPGWREVIGVAGIVVAVVLGAAILTSVLPTGVQELVFHTPLAIIVLIVGTAWLLWRISRRTGSAER
jgi:FtsH-binding integral membrane protein